MSTVLGSALAWWLAGILPAQAHDSRPAQREIQGALGQTEFPTSGAVEAQADFMRGLLLLHSFEFDAARRSFQAASSRDPGFAMAYWGEALTYNMPIWGEQDLAAARATLARLAPTPQARQAKAPTERERAYLAAVEQLYGDGDKAARDANYSAALGELSRRYPDDLDARSFYALSLLALTGVKRDTGNYMRAAAEAEAVYEINPEHPGALHYLVHAYDDPVHAPLGLRAARRYGKVATAASHAQHMPSHIFFALGLWDDAIEANIAAMATARLQGDGGYHPMLWLAYAYLQQGRRHEAKETLGLLENDVATKPTRSNRDSLAYARAMWLVETADEAGDAWANVDSTDIATIYSFSAHDFARGVLAASAGRLDSAQATLERLHARAAAAGDRVAGVVASRFDTVTPEEILQARLLAKALGGAIRFARGEQDAGLAQLREVIASADELAFEYGPPWSAKPLDELLGELLLAAGRHAEAVVAFEKTLAVHPNRRLSKAGLSAAHAARDGG